MVVLCISKLIIAQTGDLSKRRQPLPTALLGQTAARAGATTQDVVGWGTIPVIHPCYVKVSGYDRSLVFPK